MFRFNPLEPPEDGLPPGEVRVTELRIEPWPDGRRLKVFVTVTPFLERPNVTALIQDDSGQEVASTTIVETIDFHMVFTMHLRTPETSGAFLLTVGLAYPDLGEVHQRAIQFHLPV